MSFSNLNIFIKETGPIQSSSSEAGVGYATGAGSGVTQDSSASNPVTIDAICGRISTVSFTTAAGAEQRFTVNNSTVSATDVVVVGTTYNGAGTPVVSTLHITDNAFDIVVTNLHASAALNNILAINFAVIKSVNA